MNSKYKAFLLTILLFISVHLLAAHLLDINYSNTKATHNYTCAAIAVRDNVAQYQKTATKLFTRPQLKKMYNNVYYLEEKKLELQKQKFILSLKIAAMKYDSVDIFLLAHGNNMVEWLYEVADSVKRKIRLVYNCGCGNYSQGEIWKSQRVKHYLAHKGKYSYSPIFYFFFLKRWANGCEFYESISKANKKTQLILRLIGQSKTKATESCATLYPCPL